MLRLLVFFIAFSIALNLQSCINDATTYVKKKINLFGIESNNTEEKSRPEDDQPLAEINPVVANGKQFVIELFKIEFYYPKDWKIQINSMEKKDVDVNLQTQSDEISVRNSDMVFAGYGIVAPEYNWNDYEGINVKGKIVVVLVNDPGFGTVTSQVHSVPALQPHSQPRRLSVCCINTYYSCSQVLFDI